MSGRTFSQYKTKRQVYGALDITEGGGGLGGPGLLLAFTDFHRMDRKYVVSQQA